MNMHLFTLNSSLWFLPWFDFYNKHACYKSMRSDDSWVANKYLWRKLLIAACEVS